MRIFRYVPSDRHLRAAKWATVALGVIVLILALAAVLWLAEENERLEEQDHQSRADRAALHEAQERHEARADRLERRQEALRQYVKRLGGDPADVDVAPDGQTIVIPEPDDPDPDDPDPNDPDPRNDADPDDAERQESEAQERERQDAEVQDGDPNDPDPTDDPDPDDPEQQDPEVDDPDPNDPDPDDPDPNDPAECGGEFVCRGELNAILAGYATREWVLGALSGLGCHVTGGGQGQAFDCTITGRP